MKFTGQNVFFKRRRLLLTESEILQLDSYFELSERDLTCSLPIEIAFEMKNGLRTVGIAEPRIFPCFTTIDDIGKIDPLALLTHLSETPNQTPEWRTEQPSDLD